MKKQAALALLLAATFAAGSLTTIAAEGVKKITAEQHTEYTVTLDDKKQTFKDGKKALYPLVYDKVVYLPAEALSDALGFGFAVEDDKIVLTSEDVAHLNNEGSTMDDDRIAELEGVAVFWSPTGNKIHLSYNCNSFKKGIAYAGTLEDAIKVRDGGFCGTCSKTAEVEKFTVNTRATKRVLELCYTAEDFDNKIPASAYKK